MRKLILFLLFIPSLFSSDFYDLDPFVSVAGCVHALSGEVYVKQNESLTENITLHRVYCDGRWTLFPHTHLTLYGRVEKRKIKKKIEKTYIYDLVKVADPNGYIYTYFLQDGQFYLELPKGYTNTSHGEISATTNLKNQVLEKPDFFSFKLLCPDKTERIYRKRYSSNSYFLFLLESEKSPDGKVLYFDYDGQNQLRAIRCEEETISISVMEDSPLEEFIIEYTLDNKVKTLKNIQGEVLYTFSYFPQKTEVINAKGEKSIYFYNSKFLPETITHFSGETTYLEWDSQGELLQKKICDAQEKEIQRQTFSYDEWGNPIFETQNDAKIHRTYDLDHRLTSVSIQQSQMRREITIEGGPKWPTVIVEKNGNQLLRIIRYIYSSQDMTEEIYNPDGSLCISHTIAKEAIRRPWEELYPIGTVLERDFEVKRDGLGRMIDKSKKDEKGQLIWEELWTYNALHLLSYTDPSGLVTEYTYNEKGQKEKELIETEEGKREKQFFYDEQGRVGKISCGTIVQCLDYDKHNRLCLYSEEDLSGNIVCKAALQYTVDGIKVTEQLSEGAFSYPLPKKQHSLPVFEELPGVHRTYDSFNRLTEMYTDDGTVHYKIEYNPRGQPICCIDHVQNTQGTCTYDLFGNLIEETLLNGQTLQYSYDAYGRCTSLQLPDASSILYRWGAKHLEEIHRNAQKFAYCHRLMQSDLAEFPIRQRMIECFGEISYALDNNKCIASQHSRYLDQAKDLLFETVSLSDTKPYIYQCDGLGRIVEIEQPERILTFTYDVWNRRLTKTVKEWKDAEWQITQDFAFLYDHEKEIGAMEQQENRLEQLRVCTPTPINPGDDAIAYELDGMPYVPLYDLYGNVRVLLSAIREKVMENYFFSPCGKEKITDIWGDEIVSSKAHNPWRFGCHRIDEETGLVWMKGLYYDPNSETFLTRPEKQLGKPKFTQLPPLFSYDFYWRLIESLGKSNP